MSAGDSQETLIEGWAVYRFECPTGCGSALEVADHARRDPSTVEGGMCQTHRAMRVFRERRLLYETGGPAVIEIVRQSLHRVELLAVPGLGERRTVADRNLIPRPASADAVLLDDVWLVLDDVDVALRGVE